VEPLVDDDVDIDMEDTVGVYLIFHLVFRNSQIIGSDQNKKEESIWKAKGKHGTYS